MAATYFLKRPTRIEAFQMTEERRADNSEWPEWLNEAWSKKILKEGSVSPVDCSDSDGTDKVQLFGKVDGVIKYIVVEWGDWIVLDEDGQLKVWSNEYLRKNYFEMFEITTNNGVARAHIMTPEISGDVQQNMAAYHRKNLNELGYGDPHKNQ